MSYRTTHTASLVLAFCAASAVPADAGELRRDRLPAGTDWVLHLDMEAVVESGLYQGADAAGLLSRNGEADYRHQLAAELELEGTGDLERVLTMHDFDPFVDFKSLTLFGQLELEDSAVLVVDFGPKAQEILADLRTQPEHLAIEHEGLVLDAWLEDGNEVNGYLYALPTNADGTTTIAVCEERATLLRAARVLTGEQPSLASTVTDARALRAKSGAGSFVYVEVAGTLPNADAVDPTSCVFSSARALRLDVGEQNGLFLAQLTLQTDRPEEARRVAQVIQGVIALGSLAAADSPDAQAFAELAGGVNVEARDDELIADFELASSRMVQLATEHRDRRRAKRERKEAQSR